MQKPKERHIIRDGIKFIVRHTPSQLAGVNIINSVLYDFGTPRFIFADTKAERDNIIKLLGLDGFVFYEDLYPMTTQLETINDQQIAF